MLGVEDWAEIRRLHRAERVPIKEIARVLGVSRNTVRAALRSQAAPSYERRPVGSVADAFEPRIRELLRAVPTMPATVIAERIGWPYSIRTLSGRVARLRRTICRRIRRRGPAKSRVRSRSVTSGSRTSGYRSDSGTTGPRTTSLNTGCVRHPGRRGDHLPGACDAPASHSDLGTALGVRA